MPQGRLGFGISARARPGHDRLAARLEALSYDSLWANDTPGGSGAATLADCAPVTRRLDLGVGVIALSSHEAAAIAADVERLGLPHERLVIGVGSGASRSLRLVADGVAGLRQLLPDVRIAIGALGPRMCRLAGELADVVLLNWALPARIVEARWWIAEGAVSAGRPGPSVAAYVRVAVGSDARTRLLAEQDRYLGRTRQYRDALGQQSDGLVGIASVDGSGIAGRLASYREILDETIVRGLPAGDSVDDWLAVAEAAVR